jgi:fluoroacetyl-CoA thioesterase
MSAASDDAVGHSVDMTWTVDPSLCTRRGDHDLLSTPSMVLLIEKASIEAVTPFLTEGETTVGTQVSVRHVAPTPGGATVRVQATVREREGRRFRLDVEVFDDLDRVGIADHERFVVGLDKYLARLREKSARLAEIGPSQA